MRTKTKKSKKLNDLCLLNICKQRAYPWLSQRKYRLFGHSRESLKKIVMVQKYSGRIKMIRVKVGLTGHGKGGYKRFLSVKIV